MSAVFDTPIRTGAQNLDRVLGTGRPTLLVFEMPECEPCRSLVPALNELAREYAGRALVVRVENATDSGLESRFKLTRVPTLVYWQDGRELTRIEGAANAAALRADLEFLLGRAERPVPASGPAVSLRSVPTPESPGGAAGPRPGRTSSTGRDGSPIAVTDATFNSQVLQSPLPVLVDFWAPWCGPCRMVSPIVEELGRQYAGKLRVAKVNTDENPMEAGRLGIRGIPTLIFFKDGREVDRVVGAVPKGTLLAHLNRVLGMG